MMGGGARHFDGSIRKDKKDLLQGFTDKGYNLVRSRQALKHLPPQEKLLGLFQDSHLPYHVDWLNVGELKAQIPNLAEMTESALHHMQYSDNGFLLQIEGARIDHAAHLNCAAGLLLDQIAFDEAVEVALKFQEQNPDTLIIVTTDHGNGNPGLFGFGTGYTKTDEGFGRIQHFTESYELLLPKLQKNPSVASVKELVYAATAIELSSVEAEAVARSLVSSGANPYKAMQEPFSILSSALANHTAFAWAGMQHTSDMCPVSAMGPGSDLLKPKLHSTELHGIMCQALGIKAADPV